MVVYVTYSYLNAGILGFQLIIFADRTADNPLNDQIIEVDELILHYTRGITPKYVTTGGAHFRGLAPGLHSSEETSRRWRAVADTMSGSTARKSKPHAVPLTATPTFSIV